ncbi:hypothetical protein ScalyP_jg4265 [Parmales sp. scaly parma]|nr:hypothetical protein ScalyP_jg4265 [Parmales sp. scaly parma]
MTTKTVISQLNGQIRPVLDLADELRSIGLDRDLPIPQIAVMGDQSSGKSSVLEAISSIPFPRGAGLVTRCATQIRMSSANEWSASIRWVSKKEVGTGKWDKMKTPEDVTAAIERITKEIGKTDSDIVVDKEIEIIWKAPDAPDLTIIDLPGIVRTAIEGQSESTKDQVNNLLDKYLKEERTIVLAVVPLNVDVATVEILERAAQVDKGGNRTMGVLTKPDRVESSSEAAALALAQNITKPLMHGYVMVKNRTQEELEGGMSLKDARVAEKKYFDSSPYERTGARLGVEELTTALTNLLVNLIVTAIPEMKNQVAEKLENSRSLLKAYGEHPPETFSSCTIVLSGIVRKLSDFLRVTSNEVSGNNSSVLFVEREARKLFVKEVNKTKPGFGGENDRYNVKVLTTGDEGEQEQRDVAVTHQEVGSEITVCFRKPKPLGYEYDSSDYEWKSDYEWEQEQRDVASGYTTNGYKMAKVVKIQPHFRGELAERMENFRGRELPGFLNFTLFAKIMGEYVSLWTAPAEKFRASVSKALLQAGKTFIENEERAKNFPSLTSRLVDEVEAFVAEADDTARSDLDSLIHRELLPSTENHYLFDTINKIRNERITNKVNKLSDPVTKSAIIAMLKSDIGNESNESAEVQDMIDILSAYWKLAVKRYIDSAAQVVASTYSRPEVIENLEKHLVTKFMDNDRLVSFFRVDAATKRNREELESTIERLEKAKALISSLNLGN